MTNLRKSKRGGRRVGAGRKAADAAKGLKRVNILLTPWQIKKAIKIGAGNLSVGIRRALNDAK